MMIFKKIWSYLTFQKQPDFETNNEINANHEHLIREEKEEGFIKLPERKFTSMMHGINRISIFMFIFGIIVVIIKLLKK